MYYLKKDDKQIKTHEFVPPLVAQTAPTDAWRIRTLTVTSIHGDGYIGFELLEARYNKTILRATGIKTSTGCVDFGQDVYCNKVRIVFRNQFPERDINLVLTATNNEGQEVFRVTHTEYCKEMSLVYPSTKIITKNTKSNWDHGSSTAA